ncbi:hypothetical protein ACRRTK_016672 [Alexandromys fortis]
MRPHGKKKKANPPLRDGLATLAGMQQNGLKGAEASKRFKSLTDSMLLHLCSVGGQ